MLHTSQYIHPGTTGAVEEGFGSSERDVAQYASTLEHNQGTAENIVPPWCSLPPGAACGALWLCSTPSAALVWLKATLSPSVEFVQHFNKLFNQLLSPLFTYCRSINGVRLTHAGSKFSPRTLNHKSLRFPMSWEARKPSAGLILTPHAPV